MAHDETGKKREAGRHMVKEWSGQGRARHIPSSWWLKKRKGRKSGLGGIKTSGLLSEALAGGGVKGVKKEMKNGDSYRPKLNTHGLAGGEHCGGCGGGLVSFVRGGSTIG